MMVRESIISAVEEVVSVVKTVLGDKIYSLLIDTCILGLTSPLRYVIRIWGDRSAKKALVSEAQPEHRAQLEPFFRQKKFRLPLDGDSLAVHELLKWRVLELDHSVSDSSPHYKLREAIIPFLKQYPELVYGKNFKRAVISWNGSQLEAVMSGN